jgi:hypothetical protein
MNAIAASLTLTVLAGASGVALAQDALPIAAESIVHERDDSVIGCGVRVTGGQPSARGPSFWFDVSFNMFRRGIALAQAVAYEMPRSGLAGDSRPSRVAVQSAWIAAGTGSAKLGENAERQESLVYGLAVDDAVSLFDAAAHGKPLRLGIKTWGQRTASVHEGALDLQPETRDRIADCLARLTQ